MADEQHKWQVGDLCTCRYQDTAGGVIYRVIAIQGEQKIGPNKPWALSIGTQLKIRPIYGIFNDAFERKRVRMIGAGWCTPYSLVELGTSYMKLGNFIREEAEKRAGEKLDDDTPAG
jgi:hypothetical protein